MTFWNSLTRWLRRKQKFTLLRSLPGKKRQSGFSMCCHVLEKDEQFFLVAEVGKKAIALGDFQVKGNEKQNVGAIGIIVRNGYRNLGIGTKIMKTLIEKAALFGLRVVTVNAFATNKRAIYVYKKVGFVESSIIPQKHCREGKLIDEVIMTKPIS